MYSNTSLIGKVRAVIFFRIKKNPNYRCARVEAGFRMGCTALREHRTVQIAGTQNTTQDKRTSANEASKYSIGNLISVV